MGEPTDRYWQGDVRRFHQLFGLGPYRPSAQNAVTARDNGPQVARTAS